MTARQFPRGLDPLQGESLPGFLLRSAYRLERSPYRLAELSGLVWGSSGLSYSILRVVPDSRIEQAAHSLRLTVREVEEMTLMHLSDGYPPLRRLRTDSARIGPGALSNWAVGASSRYCPDCLRGDGSAIQENFGGPWKLLWHLPIVFSCIQHRRLLEHLCPKCDLPLNPPDNGKQSLLRNPRSSGVHPLACRNRVEPSGDSQRAAVRTRRVICGSRLDRIKLDAESGLAAEDLDLLLLLQERLLERLASEATPSALIPSNETFFPDLLAAAHLVKLTWPLAGQFVSSARLSDRFSEYVEPLLSVISEGRDPGKWNVGIGMKAAPKSAELCAIQLLAADVILGDHELGPLRSRIQPIVREGYRRSLSYAGTVCRSKDISDNLSRAIAIRIHGVPPRARLRAVSTVHAYRLVEIPSYLPRAWFDPALDDLVKALPSFNGVMERALRRAGSLWLAQQVSGLRWGECADFIGMPKSRAEETLKWLGRRLDDLSLWSIFEESMTRVARNLDASSCRIDYASRRRRMRDWRLPECDWLDLLLGLPRLNRLGEGDSSNLGSILVWSWVTQGERMLSPTAESVRRSGKSTLKLSTNLPRIAYDGARGQIAQLRQRLYLYAERLAIACDSALMLSVSAKGVVESEYASMQARNISILDVEPVIDGFNTDRIRHHVPHADREIVSDSLWELFKIVAPCGARLRRCNDRDALAAVIFAATSGCPWVRLPRGLGVSGQTAFRRFTEWSDADIWNPLHRLLVDEVKVRSEMEEACHAIAMVKIRASKRRRSES